MDIREEMTDAIVRKILAFPFRDCSLRNCPPALWNAADEYNYRKHLRFHDDRFREAERHFYAMVEIYSGELPGILGG